MEKVFVLFHVHKLPDGNDDEKLIGVYSTLPSAQAALERTRRLRGFVDAPSGFVIDAYVLDQDHWTEGYVTVAP